MAHIQSYTKPLLAVLLIVSLLLGGVAAAQTNKLNALEEQLHAGYARSVYESAELMRGIETNLRKLTVSASGAHLQMYLNEIARQAQGAETAVSSLPYAAEPVQSAIKAINQIGDYSVSLANRLARGGAITSDDSGNIDQLITAATAIHTGFERMIDRMEAGERIETMQFEAIPVIDSASEEAGEYPTLIYDGPFSDAAENDDFKALPQGVVTADQAAQILIGYMGADQVNSVQHDGESNIPIEVYEFTMKQDDIEMSAAVTKQGGQVLYILPGTSISAANTDVNTCIDNALAFLQRNGYGAMAVSYYYRYQNVLTINFAAMQNDVILYPDLIKVQVSMADGSIIGVECANYLKNHVQRNLNPPLISAEDALLRINDALYTGGIRLALIPINTREVLTYEVSAKDDFDNQYLIYIDAATGQERLIYQLISDENGTLAE